MAFIYQESSFQANIKPERTKLLGTIPWRRPSSSVGYSQALKNTWQDYKDETGNMWARRSSFNDSADFIGWYANKGFEMGLYKKLMHDHYILHTMKVMEDLKRKPIEKNNG